MSWDSLRQSGPGISALAVSIVCYALFMHPQDVVVLNLEASLQVTEFLSTWKVGGGVLSVHVLDFMGSLLCCRAYRRGAEGDKHWLESLLSCAIMQFGGTTLTALVLGQPVSWMLGSPSSPRALLCAWWLFFCCPGDLFVRVMARAEFLWHVPEWLGALSGGHAVTTWGVDKVVFNSFQGGEVSAGRHSPFLWLLCGVLSSSGGSLLTSSLDLLGPHSYTLNSSNKVRVLALTPEGAALRHQLCTRLFLSVLYVVVLDPSGLFWTAAGEGDRRRLGHLVVCCCQLGVFMLPSLCTPLVAAASSVLLRLCRVPVGSVIPGRSRSSGGVPATSTATCAEDSASTQSSSVRELRPDGVGADGSRGENEASSVRAKARRRRRRGSAF